jgi:uracil-DNA glycosylase
MSNRAHSKAEAQACEPILKEILSLMRPSRVVAIGRDAQIALASQQIKALPVRHPSYGGEREFREGLASAYGLPALARPRQPELDL